MANPFSSEELDGGASQALRDPVTRFRLLGYVAQVRGMSTAEALTFIERRLFPEAGVNAVSRTTLRDVLDHLNSQHFNGPPKGTTMNSNSTLDQPIAGLFEHDQDLHRTLTAICVGLGEGQRAYPKVLDALHKGVGELGGRASVREALGFANLWPETDKVIEHLHLLERRDEELVTLEQEAFAALPEQRVDGLGSVLLDQAGDHGLLLTDAGELERRLARGRRLDNGRYAGPKGREAFAADDRLHIESGIDLLATGERNTAIRGVTQRTDQRRIQLDQAISAGHDHQSKLRLLDAEVAKAHAARAEFSSKPVRGGAATEETLRLLEAAPPRRNWSRRPIARSCASSLRRSRRALTSGCSMPIGRESRRRSTPTYGTNSPRPNSRKRTTKSLPSSTARRSTRRGHR